LTMEAPGSEGKKSMVLRGYVVRAEPGFEKGQNAVGVVFTD
jgi:hypothetical protein